MPGTDTHAVRSDMLAGKGDNRHRVRGNSREAVYSRTSVSDSFYFLFFFSHVDSISGLIEGGEKKAKKIENGKSVVATNNTKEDAVRCLDNLMAVFVSFLFVFFTKNRRFVSCRHLFRAGRTSSKPATGLSSTLTGK